MKEPENNPTIPDWKCERYLLDELEESEMERIRRLAQQDEGLRARLSQLEESNREILEHYPPVGMVRQIEAKLAAPDSPASVKTGRRSPGAPRLVWVPVALAAVLATMLLLNPGIISNQDLLQTVTTRIKGPAAELSLFRRTATGSERLEDRAIAVEHDLILAGYQSDGQTYGLILSVDGRGVLTRHHPEREAEAALMAGGSHVLDFAYELDDAPLWEIFILASSKTGFAVEAVTDALRGSLLMQSPGMSASEADSVLQSLQLPEELSLSTLILIKEVSDEN